MIRCLPLVASVFLLTTSKGSLIPASTDPCHLGGLQVTYSRDEKVICDAKVPLSAFHDGKPPVDVTLANGQNDAYYTLAMVDPDAPTPGDRAYWLHWLVINIQGDTLTRGYHGSGKGVIDYKPPSPPPGNPHRYQFFVFPQEGHLSDSEISAPDHRGSFDLGAFQSDNNLGEPVAAYQLRTQNA